MSNRRILFVEDDLDIRAALADVLLEEGYTVAVAGNGVEALDLLQQGERPFVILLDLMMPVMNGWQFRAAQRKDPTLAEIPVVLVSASSNIADSAKALGAADFLRKPVGLDELLAVVSRYSTPSPVH